MQFPFLPVQRIEDAARKLLLNAFGSADGVGAFVDLEVIVYDHLSEKEGLSFNDDDPLPTEDGEIVLGKTLPYNGKILIHSPLKEEGQAGRYRFTVAHELGHWVLHRPLILADAQQLSLLSNATSFEFSSLNRSIFPADHKPHRIPSEEWQANQFASLLLVHPQLLREEFSRRFGTPPVPWRDGPVPRHPTLNACARYHASCQIRKRPPLCELFGLSAHAMAVTLLERGLVVER